MQVSLLLQLFLVYLRTLSDWMYAKVFLFPKRTVCSCPLQMCVENRLSILVSTTEDGTLQRFLVEEKKDWLCIHIKGEL